MPFMAYPKILRSIGYYIYPTITIESLRYILHAGSDLTKHEVMIGLNWMAAETLVLVIFIFIAVVHAVWGAEIRQVVWNFLAEALVKCPRSKHELLKARLDRGSQKNEKASDINHGEDVLIRNAKCKKM